MGFDRPAENLFVLPAEKPSLACKFVQGCSKCAVSACGEEHEADEFNRTWFFQVSNNRGQRRAAGKIHRIPIGAGAQGGKCDAAALVLRGELKRTAISAGELVCFAA